MADILQVFNTLADEITGEGEALASRIEGEAAAGQNGSIGFSFKDSGGNVVLPTLTADGKLPVDTESVSGTCKSAHGELAAGANTLTDITNAVVTVTAGSSLSKISAVVCCLRASLFQIIQDDNGTETVLAEAIVGPGQYTLKLDPHCLIATAGGTGTQEIKIKGMNFAVQSSLRGTVSLLEV